MFIVVVLSDKICPDSIYVSPNYGKEDLAKIVFIGNNPIWKEQYFGTKKSVLKVYSDDFDSINPEQFYKKLFNGTKFGDEKFPGYSEFDLFSNEFWSIKRILAYIFPDEPQLIKSFACTNGVLCMGRKDKKNSTGAPIGDMEMNCIKNKRWLRKTLEILEPDLILSFSIPTWNNISVKMGVIDKFTELSPECDFAVKVQINHSNSLLVNVPHLTTPKFQTWGSKVPEIYRNMFNFGTKEEIAEKFLQKTKRIIISNLDHYYTMNKHKI